MLPLPQNFTAPDFGIFKKWKNEKLSGWNSWVDETKRVMMYVHMLKCSTNLLNSWQCFKPLNQFLNHQLKELRKASQKKHNVDTIS